MIDYRYYKSGDETAIIDLWNRALSYDPISPKRFRNLILLDGNFDPKGMRLAFKNEQLVGVLFTIRRLTPMKGTDLDPDTAWIPFFFVDPDERRKGIATELINQAMEFQKKNKRKTVLFASYAPNYIVPGIDKSAYEEGFAFLLKNVFKPLYSCVAMDKDLAGYTIPKEVVELIKEKEVEGYSFSTARDKDLYDVIHLADDVFNPDWGRVIRESVSSGVPMDQILTVRDKMNLLVGFCMYGAYEGINERFGPFGVDPKEQGKKIGKILFNLCLEKMRADNLHGAWFLWTGEKSSAGHLYKNTGFNITREFQVLKKDI